jgi:hypothetical protein
MDLISGYYATYLPWLGPPKTPVVADADKNPRTWLFDHANPSALLTRDFLLPSQTISSL